MADNGSHSLEGQEKYGGEQDSLTEEQIERLVDAGKGIMVDGKFVSFDGQTDAMIEKETQKENLLKAQISEMVGDSRVDDGQEEGGVSPIKKAPKLRED